MQARGFGRIVNVGSMAAEMGAHGQVAYGAAKAALVGMTRSVAAEAAPRGVTCNLVQLGLIDTERIAAAVDPRVQRRVLANVAVGRMGTTGEAAHAVAMLCMPRASYVTGAVLAVSGGMGVGLYAREV
jgi:NAD(P)-dependent dehydrogenase (short-subunit alcohol dehydrogenase family)